jgi:nitroreductase
MEFYQAINSRRTIRDFKDIKVKREILERILEAGLKAPSNDHSRNWEFIILEEKSEKDNALKFVKEWADIQSENKSSSSSGTPSQKMYAYAMPRQHSMLAECPYVILPFFKAGKNVFSPTSVSSLNSFASIWCVIENIFLATTAEGLAYSMRIPVGDEGEKVAKSVGAPNDYLLPCYIGIGYPSDDTIELEQVEYTAKEKMHFGKW